MVRRNRRSTIGMMSLDSLVDIVSNNVGILIILAAFMALLALINPANRVDTPAARQERPPEKLLVPWSHPTNKNTVFFAMRHNRLQFIDLRRFYLALAARKPGTDEAPVEVQQEGVTVRFFPVTNQVYCLEFEPHAGAGESWYEAQRPDARFRSVLQQYPAERYTYFFWVTGDSFELFQQVRDQLWKDQYEVGWKPTPDDAPLEVCSGFEGATSFQPQ